MNREHLHLLMNRAVDGAASVVEREELARALKADPLLRSEFEDHEAVHTATTSLFRQLALPEDFSKRVMRRMQGAEVPADAESLRLPALRPIRGRAAKVVTMQRRRLRIYAVVAFVSAAAALVLAIGVITGAFSSNVTPTDTNEKTAAESRQGVPDTESPKPHRDSHSQPLPTDRPEGSEPKGDSNEIEAPQPPGKDGVKEGVKQPDPQPEPKPDEVVEEPEGAKPDEPKPEEVVKGEPEPEQEPKNAEPGEPAPKEGATVAETGKREELGRMLVLSGHVDLVRADGSVTGLAEDQVIYKGDRLRTNRVAVVMLQLPGGDITLGKETQVLLDSESALRLEEYDGKEKGLIAVDRGDSGGCFEVQCGEYSLLVMNGATVLERKRKGVIVSKAVGFATLTHEVYGSILFPEDSGYEAEIEFGKTYPEPKAKAVLLPDWCAETRAQAVLLAINGALADRKLKNSERNYVNSKLPGKLDKLMMYATTTDSIVDFLTAAINREQLDGATLVKMTGEVENAYAEVTELSPSVISHHAGRAAMVAENYDQWRDYFYRLMRPPVEPKEPKQPAQPGPGQTEPP